MGIPEHIRIQSLCFGAGFVVESCCWQIRLSNHCYITWGMYVLVPYSKVMRSYKSLITKNLLWDGPPPSPSVHKHCTILYDNCTDVHTYAQYPRLLGGGAGVQTSNVLQKCPDGELSMKEL